MTIDRLYAVLVAYGDDLARAAAADTPEGRAIAALLDAIPAPIITGPGPRRAA